MVALAQVLAVVAVWYPTSLRAACPVFEIRRDSSAVRIERRDVPDGQAQVLSVGGARGTVGVVIAPGPGQSGDLVQTSQGGLLIARCAGDTLRLSVRRRGASEPREILARAVPYLEQLDVRVNVTAWDGVTGRFRISGWSTVRDEAGPVADLFAGVATLAAGDYGITTETRVAERRTGLRGEVPLRVAGGYLLARGSTGPGREGWFVVDLAASTTVVAQSALPVGTPTRAALATERSAAGTRQFGAPLTGAGGATSTDIRVADLALRVGPVAVESVSAAVISEVGQAGGVPIIGIIGLDVLERAGAVTFVRDTHDSTAVLVLGDAGPAGTGAVVVPLQATGDLYAVEGAVNGSSAFFVLDTGSPFTFVSRRLADRAGLTDRNPVERAPRGLDGRPLAVERSRARELRVGGEPVANAPVLVGDLPVLRRLAGNQDVGLLGMDYFERFRRITVDFAAGRLTLER